ncbi:hypothetical protein ACFX11_038242 [Malus domestica]
MWYNRLSETCQRYVNNKLYPCVFIKKLYSRFTIVAVYVVDKNLIGTLEELARTTAYLKSEFKMKDLGKTRYCLCLEIEHHAKRDPFRSKKDDEEILEHDVPYLSAIGALLYLAQYTRPDFFFAVNLLARYSNAPTRRHWTGVKDIFCYLKGTTDLACSIPMDPRVMPDPLISSRFLPCLLCIGDKALS